MKFASLQVGDKNVITERELLFHFNDYLYTDGSSGLIYSTDPDDGVSTSRKVHITAEEKKQYITANPTIYQSIKTAALTVSKDNANILTVSKDNGINITGTTTVTGETTITANTDNTLSVTQDGISINGGANVDTLTVTNSASITAEGDDAALIVTGNATVDNLTVDDNLTVESLTTGGDTTINGKLNVVGATEISNSLTTDSLTINGNIESGNDLGIVATSDDSTSNIILNPERISINVQSADNTQNAEIVISDNITFATKTLSLVTDIADDTTNILTIFQNDDVTQTTINAETIVNGSLNANSIAISNSDIIIDKENNPFIDTNTMKINNVSATYIQDPDDSSNNVLTIPDTDMLAVGVTKIDATSDTIHTDFVSALTVLGVTEGAFVMNLSNLGMAAPNDTQCHTRELWIKTPGTDYTDITQISILFPNNWRWMEYGTVLGEGETLTINYEQGKTYCFVVRYMDSDTIIANLSYTI